MTQSVCRKKHLQCNHNDQRFLSRGCGIRITVRPPRSPCLGKSWQNVMRLNDLACRRGGAEIIVRVFPYDSA
ncbi:MAG: hypothetical protein DME31_08855 [Verrucomicrobia bacterium]|nr:MAG: hypothetical protein DME31_08855 [Verrucomicrobiota bacterium]